MGYTESLPVADEYEMVHEPRTPPLMMLKAGATSSISGPIKVILKEKLCALSGDDLQIETPDGQPLGNYLHVQGRVFAERDRMVLKDGQDEIIAVILRKYEIVGQTFKIYTTTPLFSGQTKSKSQYYKQQPLYTYARVERRPMKTVQKVFIQGSSNNEPEYTISRAGGWWPKKRVVKRFGKTAGLIEGGRFEGNWNSYHITINPGIDPCLMICLSAICKGMDEDRGEILFSS